MRTRERRVARLVLDALVEEGVETFFGVPGGAIAPLYDAMVERELECELPRVQVINSRHESGAVFMAMGHARTLGAPCGVLCTSGPGITNAMTGIASAWADRVPVVLVGGEVPRARFGRGALQEGSRYELDVLSMLRSITVFREEIVSAHSAVSTVRRAVRAAKSHRQGPVFLSLPVDVAAQLSHMPLGRVGTSVRHEIDDEAVRSTALHLARSRNGVIFVGSGAHDPRTVDVLARLAGLLSMPVMTTPKAKGVFPEDSPLSLGVFGYGGHRSATESLERGPDVILCVGCGLNETGTNNWSELLSGPGMMIQIDVDAMQIGRNYPVDIALVGAAHEVLDRVIVEILDKHSAEVQTSLGSRKVHVGMQMDGAVKNSKYDSPVHPSAVVRAVQHLAPRSAIFTSDIGEHLLFAIHHLRIERSDQFIASLGLGSMGSGIGTAIGAKVALPSRPVVSLCGDFGFQMYGMELATCVQSRIGVVFVVFNDSRMRMVERGNLRVFGRTSPMHGPAIDFAALAQSVGARGFSVQSLAELDALPADIWTGQLPVVLDVAIDPDASFLNHARVEQFSHFGAMPAQNDVSTHSVSMGRMSGSKGGVS